MEILKNGKKDKITIPNGVELSEVIEVLQNEQEKLEYNEQYVTINEYFERFPYEAAYALKKAIEVLFGGPLLQHDKPVPDGVIEAKLVGVPISLTEKVEIPWGAFHIHGIEGEFLTESSSSNGMAIMKLRSRVRRKYEDKVKELVKKTNEILDSESIYKGKAFTMAFHDEDGDLEVQSPVFMDLSEDYTVIYSDRVRRQIDINLLTPINKSQQVKDMGVNLKTGVVMCGSYGCGKTLTAYEIAKAGTKTGWTFIYIKNSAELPNALNFAAAYQPAIVFAEDVDRVTSGLRNYELDNLLNTLDGVDTKNAQIITILTTNNIESIHPAFLRAGRIDTIVKLDETDIGSVSRLVRLFAGEYLDHSVVLEDNMLREMLNQSPSAIQAIVDRSKLQKLTNSNGNGINFKLSAEDIQQAFSDHVYERSLIQKVEQGA